MTPASDANPQSDDTATAGISTDYSRGDHVHPLNIPTSVPISDSASVGVGTSNYYARNDHFDPLNITTSILPQDSASGSVGTANYYARNDHSHPINVETNTSNIPIVNGVGANGTSASDAGDNTRRLRISADGNTLTFNGSVIAGTGAINGASNGSVNYSAGNLILWGVNSTDPIGGFCSNGINICWRARPVTLGSVPP
ncbi:MAG: hypothetical protein EZS28_036695 [Streblomastix strix]|uniref:Uncharacterized protein n=1 Tax=Streblomastix strix TaxID=222440 RepID=A0A5J4UBE6_9EUKA|nr:MAG: hypothetical protein EZS28_036695 [Streblomastix strix]